MYPDSSFGGELRHVVKKRKPPNISMPTNTAIARRLMPRPLVGATGGAGGGADHPPLPGGASNPTRAIVAKRGSYAAGGGGAVVPGLGPQCAAGALAGSAGSAGT